MNKEQLNYIYNISRIGNTKIDICNCETILAIRGLNDLRTDIYKKIIHINNLDIPNNEVIDGLLHMQKEIEKIQKDLEKRLIEINPELSNDNFWEAVNIKNDEKTNKINV